MKINISPLNRVERILDILMIPIMYIISGTLREKPQETHFWNNLKLTQQDILYLDKDKMIHCEGSSSAKRWWKRIPIFHMPIFGGWKKYILVQKADEWSEVKGDMYIGWICPEVVGVSRIPLRSPVRLLLGPGKVSFFGINSKGEQFELEKVGIGYIGDGSSYGRYPLR